MREGGADVVRARRAQGADGEAVGEELVVGGGQGVEEEGAAGGVLAERVAERVTSAGSLMVIHIGTRSARRSATMPAYSAKR